MSAVGTLLRLIYITLVNSGVMDSHPVPLDMHLASYGDIIEVNSFNTLYYVLLWPTTAEMASGGVCITTGANRFRSINSSDGARCRLCA